MSNYQRLISYIYTYEGGMKGKNVGFAKLETRNSQCRLTVNVKKIFPGGSPLGVYLLSGDGEQRIGTLFSRNGAGEFRALLNAEQVEGSSRPLREFYGLSIHDAENETYSYTTIWEDVKSSADELANLNSGGAEKRLEDTRLEQEENKKTGEQKPEEGLHGQEESGRQECGTVKAEEREEQEALEKQEEESAEQEAPEKQGEERAEREALEKQEEEGAECKQKTEQKQNEQSEKEKIGVRDALLCQNLPQGEQNLSAPDMSGMEARYDRRSVRPRSRRKTDGSMSAREWAESLSEQNGRARAVYRTETPVKADTRAFIPIHDLEDGCSHQRMWARLRRKYPKILAFDYEPGCEILTIKPQDIGLLPRETWIFGNNSFLLHGYYSYRYLILARLENPDGEPRYLLGVPGHYCSNEKYMASMFGFPDFIMSKKQPSGDDCFGYWYTDVRVGD